MQNHLIWLAVSTGIGLLLIIGLKKVMNIGIKRRYDDTRILAEYMALSGESEDQIKSNKGVQGEFSIYKQLRKLKLGGYVLVNLYIPYKEGTSEVDVLWIHQTGIYVIESKNYSGIVYGFEEEKDWTQYLGGQKFSFYNPIKQNRTHINALSAATNISKDQLHSLIVFGSEATLQKITVSKTAPPVMKLDQLTRYCKKQAKSRKNIYTKEDVSSLANELFKRYALATTDTKAQHIDRIRSKYGATV